MGALDWRLAGVPRTHRVSRRVMWDLAFTMTRVKCKAASTYIIFRSGPPSAALLVSACINVRDSITSASALRRGRRTQPTVQSSFLPLSSV